MSAYIEDKAHIDALVTLARWGPERVPDNDWRSLVGGQDAETGRVGQMLADENIKSVQYRYDGEALDTLPGPIDKSDLLHYHYVPGRRLTAVEGLKALHGYEYQSCEHPDWEESEAYRWVERLHDALIRFLPGYAEADTWSISDTER